MCRVKRNRIILGVCVMLFSMIFTGCVSEEERAQAEAWRKRAEENAVTYIQEKYGFEATVIDSESQRGEDLFKPRYLSKTLVTMEYNGKQFKVLSYGEDDYMDTATDNYQKDELVAAVEEEVTALFGTEPDFFDVSGGDNESSVGINSEEFYDMFYNIYYDGTNLEEVLTSEVFYCAAEFVGEMDLEGLYEKNKTPLFEHRFVHSAFITYDSRENMEISDITTKTGMESAINRYAPYINDALTVEGGEATPCNISVGQCEDFYYMNVGVDTSQYSISKDEEMYDADDWNGDGFIHATFATDEAYYLEGETENSLYIYIPEEKYAKIPTGEFNEHLVVTSRFISETSGNISYNIWYSDESIPGYVVYHTAYADFEDFSFRFMYDAEESE